MFKYLAQMGNIKFDPLIDDTNIFMFKNIVIHPNKDLHDILVCACMKGQLEFVKYLMSTYADINIHANDEFAFIYSCENGHLHIAQWLINTYNDIEIHANHEQAFRWCCSYGHLHIAQWLISLVSLTNLVNFVNTCDDINIHIHDEYAFRMSCTN